MLDFARVKFSAYLFVDAPAGCPLWLLLLLNGSQGICGAVGTGLPAGAEMFFCPLFMLFPLKVGTSFSFVNKRSAPTMCFAHSCPKKATATSPFFPV